MSNQFKQPHKGSLAQSAWVWHSDFMWLGIMFVQMGNFWKVPLTHVAFNGFCLGSVCIICRDWSFCNVRTCLITSPIGIVSWLEMTPFDNEILQIFLLFPFWNSFRTFTLVPLKVFVVGKNLLTFLTLPWFMWLHSLRVGRSICDCWDLTCTTWNNWILLFAFLCVAEGIVLWMLLWHSAFIYSMCLIVFVVVIVFPTIRTNIRTLFNVASHVTHQVVRPGKDFSTYGTFFDKTAPFTHLLLYSVQRFPGYNIWRPSDSFTGERLFDRISRVWFGLNHYFNRRPLVFSQIINMLLSIYFYVPHQFWFHLRKMIYLNLFWFTVKWIISLPVLWDMHGSRFDQCVSFVLLCIW